MWAKLSNEQVFTDLCADIMITYMSRIINCPNSSAILIRIMKGKSNTYFGVSLVSLQLPLVPLLH